MSRLETESIMEYRGAPARTGWLAVLAAALLTAGMFVLMPFADLFAPPPEPTLDIRPVAAMLHRRPPPPAAEPLAEPPPPPEPVAVTPPPDLPLPPPASAAKLPPIHLAPATPLPSLDLDLRFATDITPPLLPASAPDPVPLETPTPVPAAESISAPPPAPDEPVDETTVDQAPVPLSRPSPAYPAWAQRRGIEGSVLVRFTVDVQGQVQDITVEESTPGTVFADAAVEAVRQWRFEPGRKDGRPVPTRLQVRIRFEVRQ